MRKSILALGLAALAATTGPAAANDAADGIEITPRLSQRSVRVGESTRVYVRVGIKVARQDRATRRAPLNLALVIDRSGSMQGARIDGARRAAMMAIDRLSPRDIVSIVSYDDKVEVEVPATRATNPESIKDKIRHLTPRGSTAIHAGMLAGLGEVRKFQSRDKVNRIILLSDGLANVGPSSPEHFAKLGQEIGGQGVTVSTIGLGLGYNEDLMARLARNADGSHVFVQEPADLTAFLDREIDEVQSIFAQDIDVTIDLKGHVRPIRALGRDAEIGAHRLTWRVQQLVAGSEQVLLAEVEVPADAGSGIVEIGAVRIGYRPVDGAAGPLSITRPIAIQTTTSRADVENSADAEVMSEVTLLTARERKEEAIKLRDAGKVDEARKVFEQNAAEIDAQAKRYKFKVDGLVEQESQANRAAAAPSASTADGWNKQRKVMRGQDTNSTGASVRF